MEQNSGTVRRCAIYTRKSSEDGLQQDFNSLHAQREACEAFIASQGGEGWRLIKTTYDDGGLSGGTMERPALCRLLTEVEQGLVDVIVVYKIDRLTRSLADFARMVEIFDAHATSFVAVTQQFNTTSSMGRLTLNVLLSFAQFEREVTGERIRDKIAASKKRGMWMGGFVPVGYHKRDRRLVIDQKEAATVRLIFTRYSELGSVRLLKEDLDRRGLVSKLRTGNNGLKMGGKPYSRGKLYKLLSNPIYKGEIRHLKTCHPGQHEPIIDREFWEKSQHLLAQHAVRRANGTGKATESPLVGKLFDESGFSLTPTHAVKNRHRYRYYVSRELHQGAATRSPSRRGWRLPAPMIERCIATAVKNVLYDRTAVAKAIVQLGVATHRIMPVLDDTQAWGRKLEPEANYGEALRVLVKRAELKHNGIELLLKLPVSPEGREAGALKELTFRHFVPVTIQRRGVEMHLIIENENGAKVDMVLLKATALAHRWFNDLVAGKASSIADIAARERVSPRYVGRGIRLAFLAPDIVAAIAEGRQPPNLTTELLLKHVRLPTAWFEQRKILNLD